MRAVFYREETDSSYVNSIEYDDTTFLARDIWNHFRINGNGFVVIKTPLFDMRLNKIHIQGMNMYDIMKILNKFNLYTEDKVHEN